MMKNKIAWIQTVLVAGVLFVTSCAINDNNNAVTAGDQYQLMPSARSPHDLLAMLKVYTGGLGLANDQTIQGTYDINRNALAWNGSVNTNSVKAIKEVVAIHCQRARANGTFKPMLYGPFRDNIAPRNAQNALVHPLAERKALVTNLLTRATGNRPTDDEVQVALTGLNDMLGVVANTAGGTATVAEAICTAIGSSALAGTGF